MNAERAAISRGEIVGGHYRLERILAEGGMGIVWAARDLRLGRSVAIKFLGANALSNPIQRERFAREAQLASKIRSPHVVQIIGDGMTDSGVPFVVMELLDGECLAAFLAREGRCSLATCGSIVEQICRALSSAHSFGLVHRDIKPANIFLTPLPGGEVFVRLLDFGIAKELHFGPSGLTRAGELLGSTDYMSPEQFRKPEAVSAATDIWALGVVVYQMLTGKLPFDESTFPSLAVRVSPGSFPPPSAVFPGLPAAIDEVVLHALAIHPSQRYASVDEFGAEFLRVVRAHISLSVVRADIVRVFDEDASQDYEYEQEPCSVDRPTLQVRGWAPYWGVVLVALCGMVLIGSFMVLERSERRVSAGEARVEKVRTQPAAAASPVDGAPALLPVAASGGARQPLAAAKERELEPLPSAENAAKPLAPAAQPVASALVGAPETAVNAAALAAASASVAQVDKSATSAANARAGGSANVSAANAAASDPPAGKASARATGSANVSSANVPASVPPAGTANARATDVPIGKANNASASSAPSSAANNGAASSAATSASSAPKDAQSAHNGSASSAVTSAASARAKDAPSARDAVTASGTAANASVGSAPTPAAGSTPASKPSAPASPGEAPARRRSSDAKVQSLPPTAASEVESKYGF